MQLLKTSEDLEKMRIASRLAAQTLRETGKKVAPGISTADLDEFASAWISQTPGAKMAALGYQGFPRSICTSVNDVVCHGIPKTEDVLQSGDIVNIDVTILLNGFHGDTSATFYVGDQMPPATRNLVERTREVMWQAFAVVTEGNGVNDIGVAIEKFIQPFEYGIVREFTGHGIGRGFHEEPSIPHFRQKQICDPFVEGMAFTIEPMINEGSHEVVLDRTDGWTVRTKDGGLSAQFEHTCLVTHGGCEILTVV